MKVNTNDMTKIQAFYDTICVRYGKTMVEVSECEDEDLINEGAVANYIEDYNEIRLVYGWRDRGYHPTYVVVHELLHHITGMDDGEEFEEVIEQWSRANIEL